MGPGRECVGPQGGVTAGGSLFQRLPRSARERARTAIESPRQNLISKALAWVVVLRQARTSQQRLEPTRHMHSHITRARRCCGPHDARLDRRRRAADAPPKHALEELLRERNVAGRVPAMGRKARRGRVRHNRGRRGERAVATLPCPQAAAHCRRRHLPPPAPATHHTRQQNWMRMHRMATKNLAPALGIRNTASSVPMRLAMYRMVAMMRLDAHMALSCVMKPTRKPVPSSATTLPTVLRAGG